MPQVVLTHQQIIAMVKRDVEIKKTKQFYLRCDICTHKEVLHRRIKNGINRKRMPDKLKTAKL